MYEKKPTNILCSFESIISLLQIDEKEQVLFSYLEMSFSNLITRTDYLEKDNAKFTTPTISNFILSDYLNLPLKISQKIFNIMDIDKNGHINREEFSLGMSKLFAGGLKVLEKFVFEFFSCPNATTIEKEEVKTILSYFNLEEGEINALFSEERLNSLIEKFFDREATMTYNDFEQKIELTDSNIFTLALIYLYRKQPFNKDVLLYYRENKLDKIHSNLKISHKFTLGVNKMAKPIRELMTELNFRESNKQRRKMKSKMEYEEEREFTEEDFNIPERKTSNKNFTQEKVIKMSTEKQEELLDEGDQILTFRNIPMEDEFGNTMNLRDQDEYGNFSERQESPYTISAVNTKLLTSMHMNASMSGMFTPGLLKKNGQNLNPLNEMNEKIKSGSNSKVYESIVFHSSSQNQLLKIKISIVDNNLFISRLINDNFTLTELIPLNGFFVTLCDDYKFGEGVFYPFALIPRFGNNKVASDCFFICETKQIAKEFFERIADAVSHRDFGSMFIINDTFVNTENEKIKMCRNKYTGQNLRVKIVEKKSFKTNKDMKNFRESLDKLLYEKVMKKTKHDALEDRKHVYIIFE
jgi:hypothetical protein